MTDLKAAVNNLRHGIHALMDERAVYMKRCKGLVELLSEATGMLEAKSLEPHEKAFVKKARDELKKAASPVKTGCRS